MKKIIMISSLILLTSILTGCFNSGKKVSCVSTYKDDKYEVVENIKATIKDDKVVKINLKAESNLKKFKENEKEEYFQIVKKSYAKFESDAMTSKTELKEDMLYVDFDIDVTKATEIEMKNYNTEFEDFVNKNYSVSDYKKKMEELNYKCS